MTTMTINLTSDQSTAQQRTEIRIHRSGKIDIGRSYSHGRTPEYRQEMTSNEAEMLANMLLDAALVARRYEAADPELRFSGVSGPAF